MTSASTLRFATIGSVDDGKSTLIGRILYDSHCVFEDQIQKIKSLSPNGSLNFALFADGLKIERTKGMTVDVAYRYARTPNRSFILLDSPGHFEYTKNMLCALTNADLLLLLADVTQGISEQTKRHAILADLIGVKNLILCVNKMDLVNYAKEPYKEIESEFFEFSNHLNFSYLKAIPISALHGENVVYPTKKIAWYPEEPLLKLLENCPLSKQEEHSELRFTAQRVTHKENSLYISATIQSGEINIQENVVNSKTAKMHKIKRVYLGDSSIDRAYYKMAVTLEIGDSEDVHRGTIFYGQGSHLFSADHIRAKIFWISKTPLDFNKDYLLQMNRTLSKVSIKRVNSVSSIDGSEKNVSTTIKENDLFTTTLELPTPLFFEPYKKNKELGSFILIDPETKETLAAGVCLT